MALATAAKATIVKNYFIFVDKGFLDFLVLIIIDQPIFRYINALILLHDNLLHDNFKLQQNK